MILLLAIGCQTLDSPFYNYHNEIQDLVIDIDMPIIFDTLDLKTMGYITNVMPICMTKFETDALVSTKKLYLNLPICILPSPAPTYIPS